MKKKLLILGRTGMVGSSILRLANSRYFNILSPSRKELNLFDKNKVQTYFYKQKPDIIILAAARVGGIYANDNYSADFIYENILIQTNVISSAHEEQIKKLVFLASSCIYPKQSKQPIKEEYLLSGKLEKTNESYAIAKISGIKMIEAYRRQYSDNFISVMPTNTYGVNDNFHNMNSHVVPALILKFYNAVISKKNSVILWGTGNAKRDLLYVDDLADAILYIVNYYNKKELINIGSGEEISIKLLAKKISRIFNYKGKIIFDNKYPDGTLRKLLEISKISKIGWKKKYSLDKGLKKTIDWFLKNQKKIRKNNE
jgi:GDP-L-fucose synthase